MKKSQSNLLKLASKFGGKYAQSQTLQQIIEAAAGWGEQSANGIMNFPAQLQKDQAGLSISVTVSDKMMGGRGVEVSTPAVEPSQFASNYAKLPGQIKAYLEKHIANFPQIETGTTVLKWPAPASSGVAQN